MKLTLAQTIPYYQWIFDTFKYAPYQGWGWNHTSMLGPYSLLWWGAYRVLTSQGPGNFVLLLLLGDVLVLNLASRVYKSVHILMLSSLLSSLYFYYDPADLLIVWIGLFGFYRARFSIVAFLTKLPIGSFDPAVWSFVRHSLYNNIIDPVPFAGMPQWTRYAFLGGLIMAPLIALPIRSLLNRKISVDMQRHITASLCRLGQVSTWSDTYRPYSEQSSYWSSSPHR